MFKIKSIIWHRHFAYSYEHLYGNAIYGEDLKFIPLWFILVKTFSYICKQTSYTCILSEILEVFSLSQWKREHDIQFGVPLSTWTKALLLEHLDIAQYRESTECQRGSGLYTSSTYNYRNTGFNLNASHTSQCEFKNRNHHGFFYHNYL